MNAMAEPQAFALPKKPRIKQQEPPPDQRKVCVLPIRAVFDSQLTHGALQVLAALCAYCNRAGITWVSQTRLASELGISQQAVAKQFKQLREHGYLETVRKGFKGERTDTLRVIFDPSVDADTAIAVTSSQEDTRPPVIRKEQQMEDLTPDPEGQRRVAQLIAKALKQPTKKEFQMPKTGQTRTVQRMHEEIAKAKGKRPKPVDNLVDTSASIHNPQVVNESSPKVVNEAVQLQPGGCAIHNLEVVDNTVLTPIRQSISKDSFKELNTVLHNRELREAGLNEQQIAEGLEHLLAAYKAEGLTPNPDRLATEILQLHRDTNR